MTIIELCENHQLADQAATWFSEKWNIPVEAYRDSIEECIRKKNQIPRWYVVQDHHNRIIAGAGVIENDFHDRKDLSPNLCALFVEELYRNRGIGMQILNFARKDMGDLGFESLYLITDHTSFYEKCGWKFSTMVQGDEGRLERMYVAPVLKSQPGDW